jgi:hypothetical protein
VSSIAPSGEVSDSVTYAFYVGATLLISAVCWSAFTTREFAPEVLDKFDGPAIENSLDRSPDKMRRHAWVWLALAAGRPCARRALRARVLLSLMWSVPADGESPAQRAAFTTILSELDSMSAQAPACSCSSALVPLFTIFIYDARRGQAAFGSNIPGSPGMKLRATAGVLFGTNALAMLALVIPFSSGIWNSRGAPDLWM